jgi:tripartite-type tricarboxylate transporter receptor subunit TctC
MDLRFFVIGSISVQWRVTMAHKGVSIRTFLVFVVAALLVFFGQTASSQTARTTKIVVPAAPGGVGDTVARLLGSEIGGAQGQTIIIENRTGAGGLIAADAVARAVPDGNTVLMTSPDLIVTAHVRKLNFDLLTSFEPICEVLTAPTVIAVNAASPYRTLADLFSAARNKAGDLTMASYGPATAFQIAFEMLKHAANVNMIFLPYPGNAPAVTALLGDHVTSVFTTYSTASEQLNAGKLRALATASRVRIDTLRDVPTVAETGYADYEMDYWLGLLAPAKTPKEKISQLSGWLSAALRSPELRAKLAPLGLYSVDSCGADFTTVLRKQYDDFGRIIRDSNIKAE